MQDLFLLLCYLSALLILGALLRFKIKLFQQLFIPASVIGGFIGLFTNSLLPLSWTKNIASIPSILIVPIIVSIPLGMELDLKREKKSFMNVVKMLQILLAVTIFQLSLGLVLGIVLNKWFGYNLYSGFGAELNAGFAGGHGTAGMIGRIFKDMGSPNWELAQGVATSTATFGLIGGLIIGIAVINYASRKKKTTFLDNPQSIPQEIKQGLIREKRPFGYETVHSSCLDTLSFHFAIVMMVSGIAFILTNLFKAKHIPILSSLSVWIIGMIIMLVVWLGLKKTGFDFIIDKKVKTKITITFTDLAIVSAVSTLPVKLIFSYIVPILLLVIFGFIGTYFCIFYLCNKYFKNDYPFERGIALLGTSYGVFFTGVLLLRICDPESKLPILEEYSLSFALIAFVGPLLILGCVTLSSIVELSFL